MNDYGGGTFQSLNAVPLGVSGVLDGYLPGKTSRATFYARGGKRSLDVVMAIMGLAIAMIPIAVLALLIARDGGNPFFGHVRIGRNGRKFRCWKLRSMVPDAEAVLQRHLTEMPAARREWLENFKLAEDPRVTRLGALLRRTSLDELPQLWNVLVGEMSVVGPRPVTEPELVQYGNALPWVQSVRPGVTGLWQISGRNDISYARRVRLDTLYARKHGIRNDLLIIAGTVGAVFLRTGK